MDEKNPDITPENNENNNTFEDDFVIGKGFKTHLKTLFGFSA